VGSNARDLAALGLFGIEAVYRTFYHHPIQPTTEITAVEAGTTAHIRHAEGTRALPEDGRKVV